MRDHSEIDGRLKLADLLVHDSRHFRDKVAVRFETGEMTYGQLASSVDRLASLLAEHIGDGGRAVVWLPNSFNWITSFLALNKLGAVSVPVSTRLTAAELKIIVEDAEADLVLAAPQFRGRHFIDEAVDAFGTDGGPVLIAAGEDPAGSDWRVLGGRSQRRPRPSGTSEDFFCIQYTSGTTATPKGVMLTNRSYILTTSYVARCQRLTPSSNFFSAAPFFHCSGSMHAISVCLTAGCTLNAQSAWDPEAFLDTAERYRCDVSHGAFWRDVLALGGERARPKLTTLNVSHDLGQPEYLMRLHDELGVTGISNIYGMSETAGQYTMWFPDDPLEKRVSGNGRPQPGNRLRIVGRDGAILGPGETGEIQMKGLTVTAGYYNRPEANATAFTEDGWLRSGDLGYRTEENELVYTARLKDIIRVGGENLAPDEVEQAIRELWGAADVCVIGVPDDRLDEVPAAVFATTGEVPWEDLTNKLRTRLAGFKIPRQVFLADQFPRTPTNKVQREALRQQLASGNLRRIV
jgi:acyl-CoA synthetase (AMP-forming)/AMP-acid ligase II